MEVHNNSDFGIALKMAKKVSVGVIEACLLSETILNKYDSYEHAIRLRLHQIVRDSETDYIEKLVAEKMEVIEVDINEFRFQMQYAYDKMVSTGTVT